MKMGNRRFISSLLIVTTILIGGIMLINGCTGAATTTITTTSSPAIPAYLVLTSSAFTTGAKIPDKYTCAGQNVSPPLSWNMTPAGTQSFALTVEDIDGPANLPIITHWIIFNIPATAKQLTEAVPAQAQLADGSLQGNNIAGTPGFTGPCPPTGSTHRYEFTLFALDESLSLQPGTDLLSFTAAIQGHIVAEAQTMGIVAR
jgi:Raf kinase inhibitor-like YbhB/YbcL family protein